MNITDLIFILCFLPIVLVGYWLTKNNYKPYVMAIASLAFYALGNSKFVPQLLFIIGIDLFLGWIIYNNIEWKAKISLIIGCVFNVAILAYYKYFITYIVPSEEGIVFPLGLSFFTFKAISYLVDMYKKEIKQYSFIRGGIYLIFFGQIISGPLARYNDMYSDWKVSVEKIHAGMFRFGIGFCKKILLANVLANITLEVFGMPVSELSLSLAWLGAVSYSLQLFYDFAGYSDMAIGIGMMFGYNCPENFIYPYMTKSVAEFWRRWHATLGKWFRDYIYIPLGGNRGEKYQVYFNLFVVWILTGIWHGTGWNFIVWGLVYFAIISFERITKIPQKLKNPLAIFCYRVLTLVFINLQWVIFNAGTLKHGLQIINSMFHISNNVLSTKRAMFLLKDYSVIIFVAILFCFPIVPKLRMWSERSEHRKKVVEIGLELIVFCGFVVAMSFVVAGQNNPFAYANF